MIELEPLIDLQLLEPRLDRVDVLHALKEPSAGRLPNVGKFVGGEPGAEAFAVAAPCGTIGPRLAHCFNATAGNGGAQALPTRPGHVRPRAGPPGSAGLRPVVY